MWGIKHVILITVDCLRADHVGCIGNKNVTPNIDRLAKQSIVFTQAFSNGPETSQSFPAIFTSTYFLMHGRMHLLPRYTTLAEVLRNHGFKTVGFHSNPFLSKSLGWDKGFDEFYDFTNVGKNSLNLLGRFVRLTSHVLDVDRSTKIQWLLKKLYYKFSHLEMPYLEGTKLNEHIKGWMEKNIHHKFFIWMHYMDTHYPYAPPKEFLSNFSSRKEAFEFNLAVNNANPLKEEVHTMMKLYSGEVQYVDKCIGDLLQYLKEKNLLKKSLILLTADHGDSFMEHGRLGHAYDILYNELIHVPLIIYGLGISSKINVPVQLLDVTPTIAEILGLKKIHNFLGESLLPIINGKKLIRPLFSESAEPDLINLKYNLSRKAVSCILENRKLIINQMRGTAELYDISKDFEEKTNLISIQKEAYENLASMIQEHIEKVVLYRKLLSLRVKT